MSASQTQTKDLVVIDMTLYHKFKMAKIELNQYLKATALGGAGSTHYRHAEP